MINWEKVAKDNELTVQDFEKEILTVAATVGVMMLDQNGDDSDALRFTCSDREGEIELTVRRIFP